MAQSTAILRPGQVGAEAVDDVLLVRVGRDLDVLDRALIDAGRGGEQLLDLLLGRIRQLVAVRIEELDAVVLGRVVRGRDDDAEIEREQRDGRCREHAAENAVAAGGDDAARERLFELDAARPCVTADEDSRRARPQRRSSPEALDELRRQELANDATHPIGAEVPACH